MIEGATVVLQCVVGNQRGPVQWSKDGFLLGYDREIPGFERYSMIGDANLGVHNLKIIEASNEDNGEFQCQVTFNEELFSFKIVINHFALLDTHTHRSVLVAKIMHLFVQHLKSLC